MKLWYHKLRNWEYWPVYLVYAPVFFYWIWMMIKFRSVSFYKYANPGIKNGGFYGDSKNDSGWQGCGTVVGAWKGDE